MENRWFLDEKLHIETQDVKAMNFWSLNTRSYVTMENRWSQYVKAMNFWSLTRFYLTIENRWFLDEKLQFAI